MKIMKEVMLVGALSMSALLGSFVLAQAHEIKIGKLVIHHPWIAMGIGKAPAAAYTTIDNTGTEEDTLVKVTVDGVTSVQIHDMKMEGETMKMIELKDGLVIPPGQSITLKPKSLHIMLEGTKSPFIEGEEVHGIMTFAKAGPVKVDFEVRASKAEMGGSKMDGNSMPGMKM